MGYWDSRIKDHAIWEALRTLGQRIDSAKARSGNDEESSEALERARSVLSYLGKRLASVDPFLVHPGPLDEMAAPVQEATSQVSAFEGGGDKNFLLVANKHLDIATFALLKVPAPPSVDELTTLSESIASFRDSLTRQVSSFSAATSANLELAEKLSQQLVKLEQDVTKERTRLDTVVSDFQAQFSAAQNSRLEAFDKANQEKSAVFDAAEKVRAEQFTALAERYSHELTVHDAHYTTVSADAQKAYESRIEEMKKEYAASAQAILEDIRKKEVEVNNLLGIIGKKGITFGYKDTADSAHKELLVWQVITVAALGGVIAMAIYSFPTLGQGQQFTWETLLARFLVIATFGVLAMYAGSQADKSYQVEKRNRRLALELGAIGPYLAPLPEAEQHKFIYEMGDRTFGRGDDNTAVERSPVTLMDALQVIQRDPTLLERAKDLLRDVVDRLLPRKA